MGDWAEYSLIKAVNWSKLKLVHDSARMCKWREEHPQEDKPAWLVGRALNTKILELRDEPGLFESRYVVKPRGMKLNTIKGKEWKEENDDGRDIITSEQFDVIEFIMEHLSTHVEARKLLSGTRREEIIQWTVDGVAAKGRLDVLSALVLCDLKSCNDLGKFFRDVARFLYHGQMAWYRDGAVQVGACASDVKVSILAVETSEPYDIAIFPVPDEAIEAGRRLYRDLLARFVICTESNYWPGRYPAPTPLELPHWAPGMQMPKKETW